MPTLLRKLAAASIARVLRFWYVLRDERTPMWAKGVVWSMLAYTVWPLDLVPDGIPLVGWSDDLVAILAAAFTLHWYSLGPIRVAAQQRARQIVGLAPRDVPQLPAPDAPR